jgi:toluene monooxygenase electron transfer component
MTHTIQLSGSDVAFACAADDTLLRAAQRAGLGFPYECNVGSCGNCKFERVDGPLDTAWPLAPGWTDKDRQRGRHLGCQSRPTGDCTIKLRLNDHYAPRHRPQRQAAVLRARRALTHDLAEFRFELAAPQAFEPGQYALLTLPGVEGPRAYSMSNTSADGNGRVWDVQVRRVPGGRGSAALFDAVAVGDTVQVDGPYGMAWLRRDAPRDIVCLAGGSGLAPMVSIARGAFTEAALAGRRLDFVYGGRTPADLCGEDLLRSLPGWAERGRYHPVVSMPDGSGWAGATGFVHEHADALFGDTLCEREVYFAGPPAMAAAVQRLLLDRGVPPSQQHFDQFY